MAEKLTEKRLRDEQLQSAASQSDAGEASKRQKPYEEILSLLDEEEDDTAQDVSSLITTLQQELSSPQHAGSSPPSPAGGGGSKESDGDDERERVMRHLLEASDDELGLPIRSHSSSGSGPETCDRVVEPAEVPTDLCDGALWDLEGEAANYYALLQSELTMM